MEGGGEGFEWPSGLYSFHQATKKPRYISNVAKFPMGDLLGPDCATHLVIRRTGR